MYNLLLCGQIVNTISGMAWSPMAYQSLYSSTKAALNIFGLTLRYELWDDNIKVNTATPGTVATAIFSNGLKAPDYAQTPMQAAARMLKGVQNNDRLICGDDTDFEGVKNAFNPEPEYQKGLDDYFLKVARARKKGSQRF